MLNGTPNSPPGRFRKTWRKLAATLFLLPLAVAAVLLTPRLWADGCTFECTWRPYTNPMNCGEGGPWRCEDCRLTCSKEPINRLP